LYMENYHLFLINNISHSAKENIGKQPLFC
jgi:hypothetical protein